MSFYASFCYLFFISASIFCQTLMSSQKGCAPHVQIVAFSGWHYRFSLKTKKKSNVAELFSTQLWKKEVFYCSRDSGLLMLPFWSGRIPCKNRVSDFFASRSILMPKNQGQIMVQARAVTHWCYQTYLTAIHCNKYRKRTNWNLINPVKILWSWAPSMLSSFRCPDEQLCFHYRALQSYNIQTILCDNDEKSCHSACSICQLHVLLFIIRRGKTLLR